MSAKAKILYVEDDHSLGFVVQDRLKLAGYQVHLCRDGKSALQQFNKTNYQICILDVMLPKKDGFSLAEDIRKVNSSVPILFLTARGSIEDKITGFGTGADDYLTKPFEHRELVLRVESLLRRVDSTPDVAREFHIGQYKYEPDVMHLSLGDEVKRLTKTENKVLLALYENRHKVIERDLLLNLVWGKDDYATGRSLDVYLSKLRKYLAEDPQVKIENMHGVGFKLQIDD